jgi:phage terminase large subunit-like protein
VSAIDRELRRWLKAARDQLSEAELVRAIGELPAGMRAELEGRFGIWVHSEGQEEPPASAGAGPGPWRTWLLQAGRGFGKTRAGAEWVWARVRETPGAQIALVGANLDDVVKLMIEGPSGLAATARSDESVKWVASRWRADLSYGARAFAYSAERPGKLRGPEHHFAWCDELAKWGQADATWDNLMLGLRLGDRPRAMVTTTPQPVAALRRIRALEGTVTTRGRTAQNPFLAAEFRAAVTGMYGGTRLGRQELDGELIEDLEGALWTRGMIEDCRTDPHPGPLPRAGEGEFRRIVIGVDPPAGTEGDACGVVVCGLGGDGIGYVLADCTASGLSPQGWAAKVAAAAEAWSADRVVAEANNGGRMVETVLKGACVTLPVRLVHAAVGKVARAEPVAALFESGRVKLAGAFPDLEDQLCGLLAGGRYAGPGRSPDRADACVWALTELMLKGSGMPRVRGL